MSQRYLEIFFEEKNLPFQAWEITAPDGTIHLIDTEVVKEAIFNAPQHEQQQIANVIRSIDFANGSVNDFMHHLAKGLVANY